MNHRGQDKEAQGAASTSGVNVVTGANDSTGAAWYSEITRDQWRVLIAAGLGWMMDAMDFVLYLMAITTLEREFNFGPTTAGLLASVALLTSSAGGLLFG